MTIALEVTDLTCIRGQRVLFRGLAFTLLGGRALALEGPNGSGKTSLLRLLAGFLKQASGTVRVLSDTVAADEPEERGRFIGWHAHQDAVKPQMTVREQLAFHARLYESPKDPQTMLAPFGLTAIADLPGQYLSAGQKRRLGLARLHLSMRPLWLLDEPLAALDTAGKALVAQAITAHCAAGGLVVAATHEPLGIDCDALRLGSEP
ncbi:MAG: heme ABC exporter ATP-binding protein CcmA [Alphaproteobacteria bacterium]|nr:heme ABC exporter ATP-binding protein CcmA [Alphaproteobacteria bacterium]